MTYNNNIKIKKDNIVFISGSSVQISGSSVFIGPSFLSGNISQFTTVSASIVSASTYIGLPSTVTGPEYSLQFNSGSQLSGSQNLRWDYNTNNLYITGSLFATTKSFDIVHPTKSNMRLRYGSLEGPENGVYIRGKTKQNMVELPDYWTELVDENTISVNLTPIGSKQDIWVEKIENNILYIGGLLQECYFTVFGERKDVDKLVVEY